MLSRASRTTLRLPAGGVRQVVLELGLDLLSGLEPQLVDREMVRHRCAHPGPAAG